MSRMHRQEGFTLIELMIVILIIGILVGIAVPVFLAARENATQKTCKANMKTIQTQSNVYAASNDGSYPGSFEDLSAFVENIENVSECPGDGTWEVNWHEGAGSGSQPPDMSCDEHGTPSGSGE